MPFSDQPPGTVVQPCPLAKQQPITWVEIVLLGEDDSPIPYEKYRVTLPNGDEVQGFLDEAGTARIDHIVPPGQCMVNFPALDQDAWAPL